jgi:hypothetical protein
MGTRHAGVEHPFSLILGPLNPSLTSDSPLPRSGEHPKSPRMHKLVRRIEFPLFEARRLLLWQCTIILSLQETKDPATDGVRVVGCPGFDAIEFDDDYETLNAERMDESCERVGLDDGEQPTDEIKKVRSKAETSEVGRLGDGRVRESMESRRPADQPGPRRLIYPGVSSTPDRDLTECR